MGFMSKERFQRNFKFSSKGSCGVAVPTSSCYHDQYLETSMALLKNRRKFMLVTMALSMEHISD